MMNGECQLSTAHAENSNNFDLSQPLPYNETYFSDIPDDQDWKIEKVVAAIDKDERRFYKVKWVRYLWQSEESLQSINQLINDYWINNGNDIALDVSSLPCSSDEKLVLNEIPSTVKQINISDASNSTFSSYHTPSVNLYSSAEKHESPPDEKLVLNEVTSTEKHIDISNVSSPTFGNYHDPSCSSDEKLILNETPSTKKHIDISNVCSPTFSNYHTPSVNMYSSAEKQEHPPDILYSSTEKHECPPDIPLHITAHLSLPPVVCSTKESEVNAPDLLCTTETNSESSLLDDPYVQTSGNNNNIIALQINENVEIKDADVTNGDIHSQVQRYDTDESITRIEPKFINPATIISFTINAFDYKKFKCDLCDKAFERKTSLQRHALIHTGEKPFHCNYCSKSFNQNAILQRHLLIHTNSKSFACDVCEKTFVEKGALQRHRATHDGEKNWVCEICGKGFILKEYLSKHVFLHSGKRPYTCDKCGHSFADSSAFKRHQKVHHHRDSEYACVVCQKQHKNLLSLKKHQKHCGVTGVVPCHECVVCKMKCNNEELLNMHKRTHLPPFQCNACNIQFQNYDEYSLHIATHGVKTEKISEICEENVLIDQKEENYEN